MFSVSKMNIKGSITKCTETEMQFQWAMHNIID